MTVMFARTLWRVISSIGRQALVGDAVVGGDVTVGAAVAVGAAVVGAGVALVLQREASTSSRRLPPRRKRARMPSTKQPNSCAGFL